MFFGHKYFSSKLCLAFYNNMNLTKVIESINGHRFKIISKNRKSLKKKLYSNQPIIILKFTPNLTFEVYVPFSKFSIQYINLLLGPKSVMELSPPSTFL